MQQSMACRTTPHSTPHDAAAGSYDSKTALAWREERERRRGQEPDSTSGSVGGGEPDAVQFVIYQQEWEGVLRMRASHSTVC